MPPPAKCSSGRPPSLALPSRRHLQDYSKSYQRIFDEIFWRGVVCSLEEVNRLDNFTKFKAFELWMFQKNYCLLPKFFTVRVDDARRGHQYKLYLPGCKSAARYNFFSYRVVRAWKTLPAGKINFQCINGFRASLTNSLLIYQCRLNFA